MIIGIEIINDYAEFIRSSIKTVISSAYSGAIFALFIIFFFLRSFRATIIIGIAIPIVTMTTFLLMYFLISLLTL